MAALDQTHGGATRAVVALSPAETQEFFPPSQAARLQTLLPGATWCDTTRTSPEQWSALLSTVRPQVVVSAWRTPTLPSGMDDLAYVCHVVGSVRGVVPRAYVADGVKVTNWGNVAAPIVAEHALLLVLGALRSVTRWPDFMTRPFTHEDKNVLQTRSLHGRRVAVHGFGLIARELIRLMRPFNVVVTAYSAGVPHDYMAEHGVRVAGSLAELADDADVFVSCEALTEQSRGSIDRSVLGRLPPGGVFVNVGRGAIVDEAALAAVAQERGLRVASDVFVQEPLPPGSPLWRIPGALYSPHIAGPTLDQYPRCGALAIENVKRHLAGRPPLHAVTLDIYDRST